jgi:hypothetical protein
MDGNANSIVEKMKSLNSDQLAEVEDFVELLRLRGQVRTLVPYASAVSEPAFAAVWNNTEDDVYDAL